MSRQAASYRDDGLDRRLEHDGAVLIDVVLHDGLLPHVAASSLLRVARRVGRELRPRG